MEKEYFFVKTQVQNITDALKELMLDGRIDALLRYYDKYKTEYYHTDAKMLFTRGICADLADKLMEYTDY